MHRGGGDWRLGRWNGHHFSEGISDFFVYNYVHMHTIQMSKNIPGDLTDTE